MSDTTGEWTLADANVAFAAQGVWGMVTVSGRFVEATGTLCWRGDETASVTLSVSAASVDTGLGFRDRHLRSAEFLNSDEYPTITYRGTARRNNFGLRITGELKVRGTRRTETVNVDMQQEGDVITGSTATTVNIGLYGIRPRLGIVRPLVDLSISGRLVRDT